MPHDTVVYAVGDVHGCADLLDVMHDMILEDSRTVQCARKVVVYLGDYVDRGPDSKGVVDRIITNLGVFDVVEGGLKLVELAPETDIDAVREQTEAAIVN